MNPIYRRIPQTAFLCAFLSLAGSKAHAQTYVFGAASYSAPGVGSTSPVQGNAPVATADLNGDGIPDAVILGTTSSGQVLSIFLGRPDGTFGARVDYTVQTNGFTLGDFNGDGRLDVIVVPSDPTGASIFLGFSCSLCL